jgi:2-dehydropantoate 2-reductase
VKIVVLGAGGVGGYFGGRLAAGGQDVTFVARGAHLEAIRRQGLRILSPRGDIQVFPAKAIPSIAEVEGADLVLIGVKLWDLEGVAPTLRPLAERATAIFSPQNGVQKDELLRRYVPPEAVMGGVCYIPAVIEAPGVIRHNGTMQRLVFGEYGGRPSARAQAFLDACRGAGIDAELSGDVEQLIWEKFVFLVGLSGTTSFFRQPIGRVREHAASRALLLDAMREVVAVGRARGVRLSSDFAEKQLAVSDTLPAAMTSSMHEDLERGHRLELPWLSGGVVEMGAALGIATPANNRITDALAPFVQGRA